MKEVKIYVDDDDYDYDDDEYLYPSISSSAEIIFCRICHEAEFESSKTLECPCSCSGTVKFAHRDCIQRWVNEKGNTTCEICLQTFEPGYTSPVQPIHHEVSLEVPERDVNLAILAQQEDLVETEHAECSSAAADTSAYICRALGLIFTLLLLVRHLFAVLVQGTGDYPFTLLTLLVMRASGILVPMYVIMRTVDAIHNSITRHYQVLENDSQRQQHRLM